MRTFFYGWRRKAGVATLLMALSIMAMWVRSRIVGDALLFEYQGRQRYVVSAYGRLMWWSDENIFPFDYAIGQPLDVDRQEFELAQLDGTPFVALPYWYLVIPLTLLSAYMLLVPSRKRSPTESQPHA